MTEIETAWLAGLLEGEGSFRVKVPRRDRGYKQVVISLGMTDEDVVRRVAKVTHATAHVCRVECKGNRKTRWDLQISGRHAQEIMRAVLPHMGERRSGKIRELLAIPQLSRMTTQSIRRAGRSATGPLPF